MTRKLTGLLAPFLLLFLIASAGVHPAAAASSGNVLLCVHAQPRGGEGHGSALTNLEKKIGRRFGGHKVFYRWEDNFPNAVQEEDARMGRVPVINWAPIEHGRPVGWAAIASGKEDATIRARASDAKAFGKPIYLTFSHEPENDPKQGKPSQFIAAYRHVWEVFRQVGAKNVRQGPTLMAITFNEGRQETWWPGDDYVDWLGLNGYNWYPVKGEWRTLSEIFGTAYRWAEPRNKPMMILETGVQEDPKVPGRKAQWFRDALATMKSWPLMKGFCYVHGRGTYCPTCHWWIDTSASSLEAFKDIAHDPWMGGTGPPAVKGTSGKTHRVSTSSGETEGNRDSSSPAVAAAGEFVAFESLATNLVSGDTNGASDVFVRDRSKGETARVSVSSGGAQGNGGSYAPALSAGGRFVAFSSDASNLVSGDTNGARDVFLRDRSGGKTVRVSVSSDGRQGNGASGEPAVSADGAFVAFSSKASNLIPKDTNRARDVFVWERATGKTVRVSVTWKKGEANGSSHAPSMWRGGIVAFHSRASNLNKSGDTNKADDVFVRDRSKGKTLRVSIAFSGDQANGGSTQASISRDGSIIAFTSAATNLNKSGDTNRSRDVFVRERSARNTVRVNVSWKKAQANGASGDPSISADGKSIAFSSAASNLNAAGDTNRSVDIFVRDRSRQRTNRVSVSWQEEQANGSSAAPAISPDGRFVAFASRASNLSAGGDKNRAFDIFLRGPFE